MTGARNSGVARGEARGDQGGAWAGGAAGAWICADGVVGELATTRVAADDTPGGLTARCVHQGHRRPGPGQVPVAPGEQGQHHAIQVTPGGGEPVLVANRALVQWIRLRWGRMTHDYVLEDTARLAVALRQQTAAGLGR